MTRQAAFTCCHLGLLGHPGTWWLAAVILPNIISIRQDQGAWIKQGKWLGRVPRESKSVEKEEPHSICSQDSKLLIKEIL